MNGVLNVRQKTVRHSDAQPIDPAEEATLLLVKQRADLLATQATLLDVLAKLGQVFDKLVDIDNNTDDLELHSANISIEAEQIQLNTDTVEALLQAVRDKLPSVLGQLTKAASMSVSLCLEHEALVAAIRDRLPGALHQDRIKVADRYTDFEPLPSQNGADDVLTFAFANGAPDLVWVRSVGGVSRAHPSGGTPTATLGAYCADDEPHPLTLSGSSTLKVWAPVGAAVSVWGYRYG